MSLEAKIEALTAAVVALTAKMSGAVAAPAAAGAPAAAAAAPAHTLDTLRASLTALIAKKGKDAAAAVLKAAGCAKLSDCKPENFAALAAAINAEINKADDPLA